MVKTFSMSFFWAVLKPPENNYNIRFLHHNIYPDIIFLKLKYIAGIFLSSDNMVEFCFGKQHIAETFH